MMMSTFLKLHRLPPKLLNRKGLRAMLNVRAPVQENVLRYATASCGCPDSPCPTPAKEPSCGGGGSPCGGKHQISYKPYVPPCYKDHDHKNMELNRPMSPHLDIYGPTVPAMTSIAQRATGTILTFYAVTLAGGALFLPNGIDTLIETIQSLNLSGSMIMALKFVLGYPFTFHYFIGIRFVLWNMGKLLEMKDIYTSAYASIVAAAVLAALFATR